MIEAVLALMREAADAAILPRFRALREGDVEDKSPGEVVTVADREAEAIIERGLRLLRPDATVVGEEGSAANPKLIEALNHDGPVWLVDPLDGTSNFVAGKDSFAVMVALIEHAVTTHAWIWQPVTQEAWVAQRGAGVTFNGQRMTSAASMPARAAGLRGSVRTRFLDDEHRAHVASVTGDFAAIYPGTGCAGVDYPGIVRGGEDFILFRRTLPWDHAPGALLLTEAGGVARRWDGSDYRPGGEREGLIAARDEATWRVVAQAMLQERHRAPHGTGTAGGA